MKYLIIGLSSFGSTLSGELTDLGQEVIGVDMDEHRVEILKDRIALTYIMDATEPGALASLPLSEVDCVVVAIGHSMEASLRVVAKLKELGVKNIYARAFDLVHKSILKAMGIDNIFVPEVYAARMFASSLSSRTSNKRDDAAGVLF